MGSTSLLSVNFPAGESRGVRILPMGESYLARTPYTAVSRDGDSVTYESRYRIVRAEDPASDTYSYQRGYITVTPLKFDWTAHDFIDELESWNLQ